jgi:hypothetical protein
MLISSAEIIRWLEYLPCGDLEKTLGGRMKEQRKRILFGIIIGIVLVIPPGHAYASLVNTNASLDWSQLNIFGSLDWISKTTSTNTTVSNSLNETDVSLDLKPGWVSSSSPATISNATAQGISIADQSLFASSNSNLIGMGWSNSSGNAILTGSFTATATGWIMITVPYSVFIDLMASDDLTASAYGKTRASISLAQSGGSVSSDFIELFSTVYGGNTFVNNKSGIFGLMKYFAAGETGTFTAEVSTEANVSNPVPLPGAFLLLGPGLACIAIFRRRLTKI